MKDKYARLGYWEGSLAHAVVTVRGAERYVKKADLEGIYTPFYTNSIRWAVRLLCRPGLVIKQMDLNHALDLTYDYGFAKGVEAERSRALKERGVSK